MADEKITNNLDLFSDLLSSVGTNDKDRPLTPIECSDLIVRLKEETGDSWEKLSKRIGLGKKRKTSTSKKPPDTTQIKLFVQLQDLSRKNAYMIGWGKSGDGRVGFTIGCLVAKLPDKKLHDVILHAVNERAGTDDPIIKTDVQKILNRHRLNSETTIEEIIEDVMKIKPKLVDIGIIPITPDIELLEKFNQVVSDQQIDSKTLLLKLLQTKYKNDEISNANLSKSNTINLFIKSEPGSSRTVDEKFYEIEKEWKSKKIPVNKFFNDILMEALKNE